MSADHHHQFSFCPQVAPVRQCDALLYYSLAGRALKTRKTSGNVSTRFRATNRISPQRRVTTFRHASNSGMPQSPAGHDPLPGAKSYTLDPCWDIVATLLVYKCDLLPQRRTTAYLQYAALYPPATNAKPSDLSDGYDKIAQSAAAGRQVLGTERKTYPAKSYPYPLAVPRPKTKSACVANLDPTAAISTPAQDRLTVAGSRRLQPETSTNVAQRRTFINCNA